MKFITKKKEALLIALLVTAGGFFFFIAPRHERAVHEEHANPLSLQVVSEPEPVVSEFIEVMEGCDAQYVGECVTARTGPGEEFPTALKLRTGMVLRVASTSVPDALGNSWSRIIFDEWIRYPGRVGQKLYVNTAQVRSFVAPQLEEFDEEHTATTTKHIVVDRSEQKLYAYVGDQVVFWYPVSTGLSLTPTPRGEFTIYKKMPSRYMQGPLPGISSQYYDLPGVPWDLYFTKEGGTIHGAYWHDNFGSVWSHGCVNLSPQDARAVYNWAPVGTSVVVRD